MSDDKKKTPEGRPKGSPAKKSVKPTKSRASNHHPDEEPAFNTVLESDERKKAGGESKPTKPKSGVSRSSALLMSVLAALAGGAIGWGGPMIFGGQSAKNEAMQAALEQTRSDLANAQTEQKKLTDTLAAIQGASRTQASSAQSTVESLAALEDEIQKLRDAQPTDPSEALAALEEKVSKLATLSLPDGGEGEDGATASVDILSLVERMDTLEAGKSGELATRLEALETQISEIDTQPVAFPEPDTTPIELPAVETPQSAEETLNILIDTFPREKMLKAIEAQKALAAKKPSWIQRALSRHVKTHDDEKINPVDTVDAAQAALKRGEVTAALKLMGELNPPVRTVAAEWMGAAKKAAKLIEKDL